MTKPIQISVLGPFAALRSDGSTVTLPTRKAQGLIAYLAVEGPASRDSLAGLFWGDRNEARARHNLRQALSKIRNICGPIVESRGDLLGLDPEHCSVDAVEFLQLASEQDSDSLGRSLDMYRGNLLEGVLPKESEFQDWLLRARERVRHAACDAIDRYVALLMAADENEKALTALNRRLADDPACEPAHRNLMITLKRLGRRSDALRQYQTCVDALERELGVEPSAETQRLFAEIRDSEQAIAPAAPLAPSTGAPRIAVLPFDNLSGDADEYFADGITEDIITALSCFHELEVIARGSTFIYKDKAAPDPEIADALGAYLVRGSVQRAGERVRLSVQLLDGPTSRTLWANRFDLEMTDVFRVQDEITATVVSTLAGRVEATQLQRARKATPERLRAYDYLLRGKDHHHRYTPKDCSACIDMFEHAIDSDPGYAIAHAWLACGLGQAMVWELDDNAKLLDRAQVAAERGLELDENESECHRILAQVQLTRGNLSRSLKYQERALFLNPNDDRIVCAMAEILAFCGRHEEAEHWARKSMALNPYHPQRYWTHLARPLLHQGKYAQAIDVLEQIGRPRRDDLAYAVVANVELSDKAATARSVDALQVAFPDFDVASFIDSLPYEHAADRELIRDALVRAGL